MIPDNNSVTCDQFGYPMINVTGEHLKDFPSLVNWIREKGYGRDTGLVKLRLRTSDRRDVKCVEQVTKLMKQKFNAKKWDKEEKVFQHTYNPSVQIALKASHDAHIYQYSKAECTPEERKEFVERAVNPSSYVNNNNCCTQQLASGNLDLLREHIFDELGQSSSYLHDESHCASISGPVYGDGIMLHKSSKINITDGFSFSSGLDNLLHLLEVKDDGISYPYIYSGDHKSYFPWHIEDGGLYSINYVFTGAPKLWFGIAPKYFGLMEKITSGLRLDLGHTSCRAFLADHKVLVADPQYFKSQFQVPYVQVLQEPGDFIVTMPFGLHAGFNLGRNLAIAANFADIPWIELGLYAPICACNQTQVQLKLTKILKKHRPDLLDLYECGSAIVYPRSHPREVQYPTNASSAEDHPLMVPKERQLLGPRKKVKAPYRIKDRVLFCPECKQSFKGNKMNRLELHITKHHSEKQRGLLRIVKVKYPVWKPKMSKGVTCTICHKFYRGDKNNLKSHLAAVHGL